MKLIDKDTLVAAIEERRDGLISLSESCPANTAAKSGFYAQAQTLEGIKNFIDTLEVKEVNFKDVKSIFEGQYLSKDKVVTTIERLQDECEEQGDNNSVELLEKLLNKLDTLEVKEVEPYFYCKYGGIMPLCSDCKRNHNNSPFKTEEITTWYAPSNGTKHCIDYIQQEQPKVDLEKEIKDTCRGYRINESHEQELGKRDIENIAQYFFELGLKARKEA